VILQERNNQPSRKQADWPTAEGGGRTRTREAADGNRNALRKGSRRGWGKGGNLTGSSLLVLWECSH